jgi:transposase-like protein
MVRAGRDKLQGPVEVDEIYIGGVGTQVRGRGAERKVIVVIAAEVRGKGPGRIRMAVVTDVSAESLHSFILDNVQIGSEVRTDGWSGYNGLDSRGYSHKAVNIAASGDPAHVVMPIVHRVVSLFSRMWIGIHQGAIRSSHLAYYLDEYIISIQSPKVKGPWFAILSLDGTGCRLRPVPP